MFLKKNKYIYNLIFVFYSLSAQTSEQEQRSLIFDLLKINVGSAYEDGYWINKWFFSREFASPVNFLPFEVRYGVGATGKRTGSWVLSTLTRNSIEDEPNNITYDETSVDPIPILNNNIWGTALEIDFGLFNIQSLKLAL